MYRQGDLLLIPTDESVPYQSKEFPDGIVLRGEATGHAHRLEGEATLHGFAAPSYINVTGPAKLTHDEHDTIELPFGRYKVQRQREFVAPGEWSDVWD